MGAIIDNNGLAVWEAEDSDASIIRSSHEWQVVTKTGAVGSAVQALPDNGTSFHSTATTDSPERQYVVDFTQATTYYVWLRGLAISSGNTCHVGLNGTIPTAGLNLEKTVDSSFGWFRDGAQLAIPSVGQHTVSLYMREDGMTIDRMLMTTDPNFVPSGDGPPVTGRHSDAPADTVVIPATERDAMVADMDAQIAALTTEVGNMQATRDQLAGYPVQ